MSFSITYDSNDFLREAEYDDTLSYVGIKSESGEMVGLAAYLIEDEIFYLFYLTIRESYRRMHLADKLMMEIKDYVLKKNLKGIIGRFAVDEKMNDAVVCFLVKHGFMIPTVSEKSFKIPIKNITDTYLMNSDKIQTINCKTINVSANEFRKIVSEMAEVFDLDKLTEIRENYDKKLSLATEDYANSVIYTISDKDIILELARAGKGLDSTKLLSLLYQSIYRICDEYSDYDELCVCAINKQSEKLIERLIDGAEYNVTNLMDTYLLL